MPLNETNLPATDRRRNRRFPLSTELRYELIRRGAGEPIKGTGQLCDISSKGLAFRADAPLPPSSRLRVSMAWPARLDNDGTLRLAFYGVVLRVHGNLTVVTIQRPEFRTAGEA